MKSSIQKPSRYLVLWAGLLLCLGGPRWVGAQGTEGTRLRANNRPAQAAKGNGRGEEAGPIPRAPAGGGGRRQESTRESPVIRSGRVADEGESDEPRGVAPGGEIMQVADEAPRAWGDVDQASSSLSVEQVSQGVPVALGLAVLSIVPSVLLMTTCYIRFTVVLGLLRQGLGTPQFPPNSVLTALCLFLTCLVMRPVWQASYDRGLRPWLESRDEHSRPQPAVLVAEAVQPVRDFMSDQIERAGNSDTVWMLVESSVDQKSLETDVTRNTKLTSYDQIPLPTLAASYVLSELKVAMTIGFQILLPFLVIDLVVALLLTVLGLQNLASSQVALPFKLLLFILVDGWMLSVGRLLASVGH